MAEKQEAKQDRAVQETSDTDERSMARIKDRVPPETLELTRRSKHLRETLANLRLVRFLLQGSPLCTCALRLTVRIEGRA